MASSCINESPLMTITAYNSQFRAPNCWLSQTQKTTSLNLINIWTLNRIYSQRFGLRSSTPKEMPWARASFAKERIPGPRTVGWTPSRGRQSHQFCGRVLVFRCRILKCAWVLSMPFDRSWKYIHMFNSSDWAGNGCNRIMFEFWILLDYVCNPEYRTWDLRLYLVKGPLGSANLRIPYWTKIYKTALLIGSSSIAYKCSALQRSAFTTHREIPR